VDNRQVEDRLRQAVHRATPDVLDDILARCEDIPTGIVTAPQKRRGPALVRTLGALAAMFMLVFGGLWGYGLLADSRADTWVMLEVNPSIELELNQKDRVLAAHAKNEDAVKIIDKMDLKGTPVDVAINALVGSMLKHGYIRENANSVLLSVEGADGQRSAALQHSLTLSISQQLNMVNGAVISQSLTVDPRLEALAQQHGISYGKAALVDKIIAQNSHLLFVDLAQLSVNELNLLLSSKGVTAEGMASQGSASDIDFIGEARALELALTHAGVSEHDAGRVHIELDFDDGRMVYDVEFYRESREYEYEIDARSGEVLGFNREGGHHDTPSATAPSGVGGAPEGGFIAVELACEIALTHAGVNSYTKLRSELDKDDGRYVYEVEFDVGHSEYSYEIDAVSGTVLSWEIDD